ncbi:heterokaryon incompatibility domain-containing protein [Trichoderma ceciliae]
MPNDDQSSDDMRWSLRRISAKHPNEKITTQLVEIQSSRVAQRKSLNFIENLECLDALASREQRGNGEASVADAPILKRKTINALQQPRYVALSYTWHPSPRELSASTGGYLVEGRNPRQLEPSPVRDIVFNRIMKYMNHVSVRYLWIDQHCIEQGEGEEKEIGMQTMDRVYSLSRFPVALLSEPIESSNELQLLVEILNGQLAYPNGHGYCISKGTTLQRALAGIELLKYITSDIWFTRGWTFQENYRAGMEMLLLIPHPQKLDREKPYDLLGSVHGELCIKSVVFHEEATKLCLAYQSRQPPPASLRDIQSVLSRAGKYTILLQSSDADDDSSAPISMSPRIIKDVVARNLTMTWDRLPITANCCQYSERLDSTELRARGHSLSLSMLALCLVNGEILSNHPDDRIDIKTARALTVTEFLKLHIFHGLRSPPWKKRLTFNKGCRFNSVNLTEEGIETSGHLWQLVRFIPPDRFYNNHRHRYVAGSGDGFSDSERWQLEQLVAELSRRSYKRLSKHLSQLMETSSPPTFSGEWQVDMARIVAAAIYQKKMLCVAKTIHGPSRGTAIFIIEADGRRDRKLTDKWLREHPRYVFTSFRPERDDSRFFDANDIDKHVSLEVDSPDLQAERNQRRPRLFTKCWIYGICFFYGCPRKDVVFPWPASLQDL